MAAPVSWSEFLDRRLGARPLNFLGGNRHANGAGARCRVHSHDGIEIVYHPFGGGVTRVRDGQSIPFGQGSVVVYAPNEPHDQIMDDAGEDLCLTITAPAGVRVPRSAFHVSILEHPSLAGDIELLARGYPRVPPAEQAILNHRATALLLSLIHLARVDRATAEMETGEGHVARAERYIDRHFDTIGSLGEVADHVGISSDHLRHLFKRHRRKSLIRHLNDVRIDRAKALLIHSQVPLKQISTMCGFRDEYYFSAVFRKWAKMAPGRYRRSLGKYRG